MNIEIMPRRAGKTLKMIAWLKENRNRIMLTFSNQEADRLKHEFPELSESIYYWENWLRQQYGTGGEKEIGIDNADYILQNYLRNNLKIITMTEDPDKKFNKKIMRFEKYEK